MSGMSEKKDAAEVLSKISGVPNGEVMELLKEARANHTRLQECTRPHDFRAIEWIAGTKVARNYRCRKCGGTMCGIEARIYMEGLADAGEEE